MDHRVRRHIQRLDRPGELDQGPGEGREELEGGVLRYHIPRLHARGELCQQDSHLCRRPGSGGGGKYTPSLAGLLAACNVLRGATGYVCSNLTTVEEPEDAETAVGSGKFVLVNEG